MLALKGLALPQVWNAGDVSPTGRSRRSDSRAAVPALSSHAVITVENSNQFHYFAHSLRTPSLLFACCCADEQPVIMNALTSLNSTVVLVPSLLDDALVRGTV